MTSPEYQSRNVIGLFEAAKDLFDGDGLVLFRNRFQLIHQGEVAHEAPVHYEGLNGLTDTERPIDPDRIITDRFRRGVLERALREQGETPEATYPLMKIINHDTGEPVSVPVNVMELIKEGALPVYARSTRENDELVSLGISTLVKIIAQRVGINPVGAVVIEKGKAYDVEDAIPRFWIASPFDEDDRVDVDVDLVVDDQLDFDWRGTTALLLLQMEIDAFIDNQNRIIQEADDQNVGGRIEIVYHLASQPDMQTVVLELIDLIEESHMHLYFAHERGPNGEEQSVFKVVDDNFLEIFNLSCEPTLDIALYNARLVASDVFNET
ncbi:MAG: hypothetical protein ACOH18_03565 [Candidatus Saccharimonadaceae bacterium]